MSTVFPASPSGLMTLTVLSAAAELERSLVSARTKEALAAAKNRGVRLGRPVRWTGISEGASLNSAQTGSATLQDIADILTAEGVPTT